MPAPDELSLFVARLEAIGAPYIVTGATAAILCGQPRVTNDLDVVLRKLEYYREGCSTKHPADIRAIVEITGVDEALVAPWLARMGLSPLWQEVKAAP